MIQRALNISKVSRNHELGATVILSFLDCVEEFLLEVESAFQDDFPDLVGRL